MLPDRSTAPSALDGVISAITTMDMSKSDSVSASGGQVTCWLVDTRKLWPGTNIRNSESAAEAMDLISATERKHISDKLFVQDARMSLASALVKRLYVSRALDIPWSQVHLGRRGDPKHGKPCAVDAAGHAIEGLDFNVSHQAGLVALVGWDGRVPHAYNARGGIDSSGGDARTFQPDVQVGVDIVCVNERDDYRIIDAEGLDGWVDMYDFVFSDAERWSMKYDVDYVVLPDGRTLPGADLGRHDRALARNLPLALVSPAGAPLRLNSSAIVDAKLRRFYTYFCYTEAYVKLAGEALLAPWLKELEFSNVRSPRAAASPALWGEEVADVDVQMKGADVTDVRMKIQAFQDSFMIATAVQGASIAALDVPSFRELDLRRDMEDLADGYLTAY